MSKPGSGRAHCAESLGARRTTSREIFELRAGVLRELGEVIDVGNEHVIQFLESLDPEGLFELKRCAVPALLERLSPLIELSKAKPAQRVAREVEIPVDLPEGIKAQIEAYKARHERRYKKLAEHGHTRSHTYVSRLLSEPMRLACFMAARGSKTLLGLSKRDLVAFMQANPHVSRTAIDRFFNFVHEDQPFKTKTTPSRGKQGIPASQGPPPPVMFTREELKEMLEGVKQSRSEAEYLLTWLVARLGLMAQDAYDLTLDRFAVNEEGRLAVRPAQVWVLVPKSVGAKFEQLLDSVYPTWKTVAADRRSHIALFPGVVPDFRRYMDEVFKGKARAVRASAIYAAMREGHTDRVTLNQTIGVSISTLMKLEQLLSADLHRRLPADFVEERNKHILGQAGD
jgi:hypothetical protein